MSTVRELIEKSGEFKKPGEEGYRPDTDGQFAGDWAESASPQSSGVTDGIYVTDRGLPWHVKLGRLLGQKDLMRGTDGLMTGDDLMTLMPTWAEGVSAKEIYVGRKGQKITGKLATVREADGRPLGIVSPRYRIFQPRDQVDFAMALVATEEASIETAVELRDGAITMISLELDHLDIVVPKDEGAVRTYLQVVNSYDGSYPFEALITHVRGVCQNTIRLARASNLSHFRLRHTGDLHAKTEQARRALGITARAVKEFEVIANKLVLKEVVDDQVQEIFRKAWPMSDDLSDGRKETHNSTLAFENYLRSETIPDSIRGTAWGALQAATEYLDHEYEWRSKSRGESTKVLELLTGTGQAKKEVILRELLKV